MIFTALFRGGLTQSSVTPPDPVVWVVILRLIHRHARLTQVRTSGDHPPVIALVVITLVHALLMWTLTSTRPYQPNPHSPMSYSRRHLGGRDHLTVVQHLVRQGAAAISVRCPCVYKRHQLPVSGNFLLILVAQPGTSPQPLSTYFWTPNVLLLIGDRHCGRHLYLATPSRGMYLAYRPRLHLQYDIVLSLHRSVIGPTPCTA